MSAIVDYVDLYTAVAEYTGRTDLAAAFDRIVQLAEVKLDRELRTSWQESSSVLTPDVNGDATLPTDFNAVREVYIQTNQYRLIGAGMPALRNYFAGNGGTPTHYAISGRSIAVRPVGQTPIVLNYFAKIPTIVNSAANWLLTNAPDVYLYAVAREAALAAKDGELATAARNAMMQAAADLTRQDNVAKWANARYMPSSVTP